MTITDAQAEALLAAKGKTITIDGETVEIVRVRCFEDGRYFAICTTSTAIERMWIHVETEEAARRITLG